MQTELQQVLDSISELKTEFKDSETRLEAKIEQISLNVNTFNEKFDNYQKATQWVVSLAFSLIASATIITVASSIFRR